MNDRFERIPPLKQLYDITCAVNGCLVTFSGKDRHNVDAAFQAHTESVHGQMTGEHWYARYQKNLGDGVVQTNSDGLCDPRIVFDMCERAAKEASGIVNAA